MPRGSPALHRSVRRDSSPVQLELVLDEAWLPAPLCISPVLMELHKGGRVSDIKLFSAQSPTVVVTARAVFERHTTGSNCPLCARGWPCADRRWATRVLRRASLDPHDSPAPSGEAGGAG